MSSGSLNAECVVCPPSNKIATMPEKAISCYNRIYGEIAPASLVTIGNENPDAELERKTILPHSGDIQQY
ncbi:hypothetical protein TNCV_904001 [Trichonephila clavipes]|nr:hypothetical protein TNCV_904001 [Trichonephila clavipes]